MLRKKTKTEIEAKKIALELVEIQRRLVLAHDKSRNSLHKDSLSRSAYYCALAVNLLSGIGEL